jgi:hypothetical protein
MNLSRCTNEKEVAGLLARGGWPQACAAELRAHVSVCRHCSDLVLLTESFKSARAAAASEAPIASPGALWWRAQLRSRNAAVARVRKPILGAQVFALTTYLLIAAAFLATQARHGIGWLTWLEQLPQGSTLHLEALRPATLFSSGFAPILLIPALAVLALLGGVAAYLASDY